MKIATRHGPDQRHGHRRRGARGAFNCCPRPPRRAARGKSREGRRAPSCRGCRVHRRHQFPTNSRLSFPSFFSAPHMPDRTPGLPRARRPPAERAQRGSWRPRGRDGGSPQGPGSRAGPGPPAAREGLQARSRGPPREGRRGGWRFFILFFSMLQVFLVERGKKLQIHIGQGSMGQQIKPESRLFERSGRKKDCPGTELK